MAWNDPIEYRKIDQKTIKSLSSDTRVDILKSLSKRRKMPAELAREMGLAPSTVVEHLKELEGAGLVKRQETQHKWIYYELTNKGSDLFSPRIPFQFILMLAFGILIAGLSFLDYSSTMLAPHAAEQASTAKSPEDVQILGAPERAVCAEGADCQAEEQLKGGCVYPPSASDNWIPPVLAAIGAVLATYAAYMIYRAKTR